MPRARRKPHSPAAPQTTDTGPDTPAQRYGAVYRRPRDGRAGDVRKERLHPLEHMHAHGALNLAEKEAGMRAVAMFEATQKSGAAVREYVDGRADPDIAVVLKCDALFAYARAVAGIPSKSRTVYRHVVEYGLPVGRLRGCSDAKERRRQWLLLRAALAALRV